MTPDQAWRRILERVRRRDVIVAAAGALAGAVFSALVAAALWPDPQMGAAQAGPVVTPSVPPAPPEPSVSPLEASPTDHESEDESADGSWDDESEEESGDGEPQDAPPLADAAPAGQGDLPDASVVSCPEATTTVGSAEQLAEALDSATPGAVIELADGIYVGEFVTDASGTAQEPIFLCGSDDAVLDGGDVEGGYVLHLDGATHWRLAGFSVRNGQKGVMADSTVGTVIQDLTVEQIGDEAIHLRSDSTDNVVRGNTIRDTGLRRDKYGEGVYVGTAVSNWCEYNGCRPDRSDRNVIKDNSIAETSSEAIDVKEGTTGGLIVGNTFDGSDITGADSWVDVKGNNWLIEDNVGSTSPMDGFQTHQILPGWGDFNLFRANTANVDGPGMGFAMWPIESNSLTCDNVATGAGEGLSNIPCS